MEIPAKRVPERFPQNPGEFNIHAGDTMLRFRCPCGCGDLVGIPIRKRGEPPEHPPSKEVWEWDGDYDKPTLTPSIQAVGGCNYHGNLTAGVFKN